MLSNYYCTNAADQLFPGPVRCVLHNHACVVACSLSKLRITLLLTVFHSKNLLQCFVHLSEVCKLTFRGFHGGYKHFSLDKGTFEFA